MSIVCPDCRKAYAAQGGNGKKHLAEVIIGMDHPECLGIIADTAPATLTEVDRLGATPALVAAREGHTECMKVIADSCPETHDVQPTLMSSHFETDFTLFQSVAVSSVGASFEKKRD